MRAFSVGLAGERGMIVYLGYEVIAGFEYRLPPAACHRGENFRLERPGKTVRRLCQ